MSRPKEKVERVCVICGCKFTTAREKQRTCGEMECQRQYKLMLCREHYAKFGKVRYVTPKKPKNTYVSQEHFKKIMASIHAPIGDDEPLRRYVG